MWPWQCRRMRCAGKQAGYSVVTARGWYCVHNQTRRSLQPLRFLRQPGQTVLVYVRLHQGIPVWHPAQSAARADWPGWCGQVQPAVAGFDNVFVVTEKRGIVLVHGHSGDANEGNGCGHAKYPGCNAAQCRACRGNAYSPDKNGREYAQQGEPQQELRGDQRQRFMRIGP